MNRGVVAGRCRGVHDGLPLATGDLDDRRLRGLIDRVGAVRVAERAIWVVRPQVHGGLVREGATGIRRQAVKPDDDLPNVVVRLRRRAFALHFYAKRQDGGAGRDSDVHLRLVKVNDGTVAATGNRCGESANLDHIAAPLKDEGLDPRGGEDRPVTGPPGLPRRTFGANRHAARLSGIQKTCTHLWLSFLRVFALLARPTTLRRTR